jgi:hypothetical protein
MHVFDIHGDIDQDLSVHTYARMTFPNLLPSVRSVNLL